MTYEIQKVTANINFLYESRLKNGKEIKSKYQDKYNVYLSNKAKVTLSKPDDSRGGRGGRGGRNNRSDRNTSFFAKFDRIEIDYKDAPKPLTYEYVVVGQKQDVKIAIAAINKSIAKYMIVEDVFPRINE